MHRISVQNQFIQSKSQTRVFLQNLKWTSFSLPVSVQDKSFLESYLQSFKLTPAGKKAKNPNAVLKTWLRFCSKKKTKNFKECSEQTLVTLLPKAKTILTSPQAFSCHSGVAAALSYVINMRVAIKSEDPWAKQQGRLFRINYLLLILPLTFWFYNHLFQFKKIQAFPWGYTKKKLLTDEADDIWKLAVTCIK